MKEATPPASQRDEQGREEKQEGGDHAPYPGVLWVETPAALSSPLLHPESSALRPRKCLQVTVKLYT